MTTSDRASLHSYPTRERDRFLYLVWQHPSDYIEWIEQFTSRTVSRLSWGTAHPAQLRAAYHLRPAADHLAIRRAAERDRLPAPRAGVPGVPGRRRKTSVTRSRTSFSNPTSTSSRGSWQTTARSASFIRTFLESKTRDDKLPAPWDGTHEAMYVELGRWQLPAP